MNLNELNESQRDAVLCIDAPSLVIAGAGSGKTRVLTYKIAYLLEQGLQPWNILALTFTNKAAKEMRERIGKLVGEEKAAPLWMGTFHSIFSRILRRESSLIGFDSNFTIYDAADSKNLVSDIIREMQLDDKKYKSGIVASRISNAKNALILPAQYQSDPDIRQRDQRDMMASIGQIYERYVQRCRQSNAMDFDDLLLYTWLLFRDHPEVAQAYEERFQFVLVDEYQDTNYAQHEIVWQLTQNRQRLSVVGDDAQSIYSFRGANIDNILQFRDRYTSPRMFKLEQNYRSTQTIVGAANSLILHNQRQIRKDVFSQADQGTRIPIYNTQSDKDESIIVQREIRRLMRDEHIAPNEIAILYRTNAQSRSLEEELRRNNVPYRIYGGLSFYQRKEIKDAVAYLRMAVNQHDELALMRIINYPTRGIGATTMARVHQVSLERDMTMWDVLQTPELLDVNRGTLAKLSAFVTLIQEFGEMAKTTDAHTVAMDIFRRSGLSAEVMKGREPEDITRQENMQELMDHLKAFVEERIETGDDAFLTDYLQEISLLTDADDESNDTDARVSLMTVHASKGLEFDAVFVVGMEEMLFPSQMSIDSPRQLEEERRLFYVAMTRARRFLTLSCAKSRIKYGKFEVCRPSRFLSEIDKQYLQQRASGASAYTEKPSFSNFSSGTSRFGSFGSSSQSGTTRTSSSSVTAGSSHGRLLRMPPSRPTQSEGLPSNAEGAIRVGQRVEHSRFGQGVVQKVVGSGLDTKATILFDNGETRTMLQRFAKLRVLS